MVGLVYQSIIACLSLAFQQAATRKYSRQEIQEILFNSLKATTDAVNQGCLEDVQYNGCTLTVGVVYEEHLTCASLGDVRLLVAADYLESFVVQSLTQEQASQHRKPVCYNQIKSLKKIASDDSFQSCLPVKKAMGCLGLKELGLSSQADVRTFKLTAYDRYLFVGSQAVFGILQNKEVLAFVDAEVSKGVSLDKASDKLRQHLRNKNRRDTSPQSYTFMIIQLDR